MSNNLPRCKLHVTFDIDCGNTLTDSQVIIKKLKEYFPDKKITGTIEQEMTIIN